MIIVIYLLGLLNLCKLCFRLNLLDYWFLDGLILYLYLIRYFYNYLLYFLLNSLLGYFYNYLLYFYQLNLFLFMLYMTSILQKWHKIIHLLIRWVFVLNLYGSRSIVLRLNILLYRSWGLSRCNCDLNLILYLLRSYVWNFNLLLYRRW